MRVNKTIMYEINNLTFVEVELICIGLEFINSEHNFSDAQHDTAMNILRGLDAVIEK